MHDWYKRLGYEDTKEVADIGYDLSEIAQMNIDKLASRKMRNKINGDGDNR